MSHSHSWPARDSRVPFSRFPGPCEGSVPCLRSTPIMERTCGRCQEACVTAHPPSFRFICHSDRREESRAPHTTQLLETNPFPSFRRRPESRAPHHPQAPRNQTIIANPSPSSSSYLPPNRPQAIPLATVSPFPVSNTNLRPLYRGNRNFQPPRWVALKSSLVRKH